MSSSVISTPQPKTTTGQKISTVPSAAIDPLKLVGTSAAVWLANQKQQQVDTEIQEKERQEAILQNLKTEQEKKNKHKQDQIRHIEDAVTKANQRLAKLVGLSELPATGQTSTTPPTLPPTTSATATPLKSSTDYKVKPILPETLDRNYMPTEENNEDDWEPEQESQTISKPAPPPTIPATATPISPPQTKASSSSPTQKTPETKLNPAPPPESKEQLLAKIASQTNRANDLYNQIQENIKRERQTKKNPKAFAEELDAATIINQKFLLPFTQQQAQYDLRTLETTLTQIQQARMPLAKPSTDVFGELDPKEFQSLASYRTEIHKVQRQRKAKLQNTHNAIRALIEFIKKTTPKAEPLHSLTEEFQSLFIKTEQEELYEALLQVCVHIESLIEKVNTHEKETTKSDYDGPAAFRSAKKYPAESINLEYEYHEKQICSEQSRPLALLISRLGAYMEMERGYNFQQISQTLRTIAESIESDSPLAKSTVDTGFIDKIASLYRKDVDGKQKDEYEHRPSMAVLLAIVYRMSRGENLENLYWTDNGGELKIFNNTRTQASPIASSTHSPSSITQSSSSSSSSSSTTTSTRIPPPNPPVSRTSSAVSSPNPANVSGTIFQAPASPTSISLATASSITITPNQPPPSAISTPKK